MFVLKHQHQCSLLRKIKDKAGLENIFSLVFTPQAKEELRPVKEDFEAKNKQLLEEMPKFYHSRIDYFQPSFEALIRAQVSKSQLKMHMHAHTYSAEFFLGFRVTKVCNGKKCIILAVCLPPRISNVIHL